MNSNICFSQSVLFTSLAMTICLMFCLYPLDVIYSSVQLSSSKLIIMAALRSRCGHYILQLWFLHSFFSRLFSAVGHWMSAIFPHIMWSECEFRMHVWNVLHAACWKYRTQKWCKKSLSAHHDTICPAISSQLRHISTIGKKLVKQQYLLQKSPQYGELRPTSGGDRSGSLGHHS